MNGKWIWHIHIRTFTFETHCGAAGEVRESPPGGAVRNVVWLGRHAARFAKTTRNCTLAVLCFRCESAFPISKLWRRHGETANDRFDCAALPKRGRRGCPQERISSLTKLRLPKLRE